MLQEKLRAAYPETELMALETEPNPDLLPKSAFRIRFHSVGGYGTIATGKLLTDILAGVLDLHSKAAPKYGSEKSGAPTNYYITLSPEPVLITNAELEDVEIVVSPDHKVFSHSNPLRGLSEGGTFILQSQLSPAEVWKELPEQARKTIRDKKINFFIVDAFAVAKRHAPTPELEVRMMGIAFIGAVCGHVDRVTEGASEEAVLKKIRQQIAKKFGAKGGPVVEGNMAVIRDGLQATQKVDYDDPEFETAEEGAAQPSGRTVLISAAMCRVGRSPATAGFLDADYFDDVMASSFRDGTIAEAPVMPGTGLFMPAGSAAFKDKGLFRRNVPEFIADLCTGCMECALVCPDAAIPNTVHDIHDLLLTAIRQLDIAETQREALRGQVHALADAVREVYRREKEPRPFHEIVAEAADELDIDNPVLRGHLGKLANALSTFPVAKTRPFFDAMEKASPGSGGLFSAAIDPWKCTGCLECVDVCGPHALVEREQDAALLDTLQARFDFLSRTPNTPARFIEGAIKPDGDTKRLMLDRNNYYATTGGHGACRGCGEVTAIRLVTGANHAIHDKRRKEHMREVESLIERLNAKLPSVQNTERDPKRRERIAQTDRDAWRSASICSKAAREGMGPASAVIANATGCSSVYASTFPFNPYNDPWVNSLFQDTPAVAKGIFEGLSAEASGDIRALRIAKLDLDDEYDPRGARPLLQDVRLGRLHARGVEPAADRDQHGRRRRDLRHRLRRAVARAQHVDADQGRRAQQRRLLEHRRTGLDREPDRPGLRPQPVRRRARRQAGRAQGARADRRVPSERVRGPELRRDAGALPQARRRVPEPQRLAGGAGRLHALPGRAGHRRPAGQPPRAAGGGEPHEPAVRARSAPRRGPAQPVLARRQSGHRQGLDDQHDRIRRGRRDRSSWRRR